MLSEFRVPRMSGPLSLYGALFMLGDQARIQGDLSRAEELLRDSVEAVALAGQSFVMAWALEALAAVYDAAGRPRTAAVILGAASRTREAASAHMRPAQPIDGELQASLKRGLGAAAFTRFFAEGEQLSPIQVLQHAPWDESGPA